MLRENRMESASPQRRRHRRRGLLPRLVAILLGALSPSLATAVLPDEIQVYTDDIQKPGELGLELHANTTIIGRTAPSFPNEVTPEHAARLTPEFSYGLTRDLEPGLYLPIVRDAQGETALAGWKIRLKWLPLQDGEGRGPWFAGVNTELAFLSPRFENGRRLVELRFIVGYRSADWLLAVNPILNWTLDGPAHSNIPDSTPAAKAARTVLPGVALGFEYYTDLGKFGHWLPPAERVRTLYLAIDVNRAPWVFNFGVGKGLDAATDRWTLKAIFEIPI